MKYLSILLLIMTSNISYGDEISSDWIFPVTKGMMDWVTPKENPNLIGDEGALVIAKGAVKQSTLIKSFHVDGYKVHTMSPVYRDEVIRFNLFDGGSSGAIHWIVIQGGIGKFKKGQIVAETRGADPAYNKELAEALINIVAVSEESIQVSVSNVNFCLNLSEYTEGNIKYLDQADSKLACNP